MGAALFGFGVTVAVERGCHTLSLVALKSELAGKLLQRDPVAARREIDEVGRVAREALTQVRAAVTGIRAAVIAAELASAKLLLESDGVAFKYARVDTALPPGVENARAMTVREAVTISSATPARSMPKWPSRPIAAMSCCISSTTAAVARSCRAMAWAACAKRIEALGGRLRIDSGAGRGTRIEARLPLAANDDGPHAPRDDVPEV